MTKSNYEMLGQIYSAMGQISTKGEDTLIMADCLRAVNQLLMEEKPAEDESPEVVE